MSTRIPLSLLLTLIAAGPSLAASPDTVHARHVEQARQLRQAWLDRGFVTDVPEASGGRAMGVSGERRSRFDLSGAPRISGELRIERLEGRMRLNLARTRDTLQFGRMARVKGTATVARGRLRIYDRVSVDPWNMARALLDTASTQPPPEDFRLNGWMVTEVPPGQTVRFEAQLLTLGGDYLLLLEAPDAAAEDVRLAFDRP